DVARNLLQRNFQLNSIGAIVTNFIRPIVLAVSILCSGISANAAVVHADAVIDLNTVISGNSWTGYANPLTSIVRVYNGDTVVTQIDFSGNQTLTWNSSGFLDPWLMLAGY